MIRRSMWVGLLVVLVSAGTVWGAPQETVEAVAAQTPGSRLITYTGTLTDAEGRARPGSATLVFSLYAQQDGAEPLWQERQSVVADELGRYTVLLGATVPGGVPPVAFGDGKAQWLGVAVEGEAEQARALLVAVPYAMKAADADTLGGKPIASFVLSTDLEKAVEKQITSVTTTAAGGVGVVSSGTVGTLGSEAGTSTWYGQYAANAGGGSYNAFFGQYAGYAATGNYNAFVGHDAGRNTTTGCCNAFVGRAAGYANTTGTNNVFVGNNAGQSNTTASDNTFVGRLAGNLNTADENTFVGSHAGYANTTGTGNLFVGYQAGEANTTGNANSFFGYRAGATSTTAFYNTFVGSLAGTGTTTGGYNTFVGRRAGESNTTGIDNAAIGWYAGQSNTTGSRNAFLGDNSGSSNTTEHNNTFVGTNSDGATGITNATAVGYQAQVTQSNSLVLGSVAGSNSATTTVNVGIGTTAPTARLHVVGDVKVGDYLRGANNVVMGSGTSLPTWSGNVELNNEAGVGFHFRALTTKFDIGPGAGGAPTYPGLLTLSMDGKVGIGTTSPAYKLHVAGDIFTTGTYQSSDLRLKDNIHDLGYGVREVLRLRPVSYRWKDAALGQPTLGLIAQEVEPVLPELVARGTDEAGLLSVNYTGLIPLLVKAVQEQQAALLQKDAEITALRAQKDAEIAALTARLVALEALVQAIVRQEP